MRIACAIFLTCLIGCRSRNHYYQPKQYTILDSTKGKNLLRQCSRSTPQKISSFWVPSEKEIMMIDAQFLRVMDIKSKGCCLPGRKIQKLDDFAFQYIGVTIHGKKYVYVNSFYKDKENESLYTNWKTEPIVMCDGGDHYWGVLFDLNRLRFRNLSINGI
jgi:hypothetical protein